MPDATTTIPRNRSSDPLDHQGLVWSIALAYQGRGLPLEDLISEGNLGLLLARRKYRPELGHAFTTYAGHWVKMRISRAIGDAGWPVRIPVYLQEPGRRGRTPKRQEYLAAAALAKQQPVTESSRLDGRSLADLVGGADHGAEGVEQAEEHERLREAVAGLGGLSADVIRLRYGLDGGEPQPHRAIATRLGLTRVVVEKIERRALERLREVLCG